ncbi:hypothetical protein PULV_a4040 [Pseudoalteromonas ulvae UL12]|uniref:conjugal transfer protein TraG N-terminal domain-containing protein n=1 Tax=Pseudoalteromonas ulvae TaxID=107327 RepID=UPI00186B64DD|nr:conjugal transfer protein TraG N-terminal domain-containing protein [Pseudoalteromonas ulvae]MBE0362225.1 hypothetical protein [Pseudoalteromonas ulvae UL12]
MTFTSLSDLYFMSIGLYALNTLWAIIVDTKLIILPIIMIVLEVMKESTESGKAFSDSGFMLKKLETRIYIGIFTIIFFAWPMVPFEIDNMTQYTKQCEAGEEVYIEDDIGIGEIINSSPRLVDQVKIKPNNLLVEVSGSKLRVPLAMQLVMSYMSGYSVESVDKLPCSINVVAVSKQLLDTQIKDTDLLIETKEFVKQCFEPARSLAVRNKDSNMPWLENPDTADLAWPGHRSFMNDAYYGAVGRGFYSQVLLEGWQGAKTNQQVPKWMQSKEAEQNGEIDCSSGSCLHQVGGFPSCREWWQGIGAGYSGVSVSSNDISLRSRLIKNLPENTGSNYGSFVAMLKEYNIFENTESENDTLLRMAYFNPVAINRIKGAEIKDYAWDSETNAIQGVISRTLGTIGTAGAAIGNFAGASMIQLAAPLAKSMVFLILLTAYPMAVIVSKFGYKFIIPFHFFVGSVFFWPFLWDLALLAQQSLIESTMANGDLWIGDITRTNTMLLGQYLTDALFLAFPTLFTGVMTAAGMTVGSHMSGISSDPGGSAGSPARQEGNKQSGNVRKGAENGIKSGAKRVASKGAKG